MRGTNRSRQSLVTSPVVLGTALMAVALLATTWSHTTEAAPSHQSPEQGAVLFENKCAGCHTIGGGRLAGSDLAGVTARRDREWLREVIQQPDALVARGDPVMLELTRGAGNLAMPNMGLSAGETEAVLRYLDARDAGPSAPPEAAPSPAAAGDPVRGKDLFVGRVALANGGAPCAPCHQGPDISQLGGGTLGPDLTTAADRFGEAGLAAVLTSLPFPTMRPIYDGRPLTPEEQADLAAYLAAGSGTAQGDPVWLFGLLSAGVLGAMLALAHVAWRGRLGGVRRGLIEKAYQDRSGER